jgi:hypothetical protein
MKIEWNKVTWYSKLVAVIFFVVTFFTAFYFGVQYQKIVSNFSFPENTESESELLAFPQNFSFKVGQSKSFDNLKIKLNNIIGDSRCPADVKCVWQGEIKTNITLSLGTKTLKTEVSDYGSGVTFEGYKLIITDAKPYPGTTGKKIEESEYVIYFKLSKSI